MSEPLGDSHSFEDSLLKLERIVRELEDGQLGLEDGLGRYEQGISLIKRCYGQLRQAEQRIVQLSAGDEEDQAILQPFKHEATVASRQPRPLRSLPEDPI